LIVVPGARVSFSVSLTLGDTFSHPWLHASIEAFQVWALPTKKTVFRTWPDVAGKMINAEGYFLGSATSHTPMAPSKGKC